MKIQTFVLGLSTLVLGEFSTFAQTSTPATKPPATPGLTGTALDKRPTANNEFGVSVNHSPTPLAPTRGMTFDAKVVTNGGGTNITASTRTRESVLTLELNMRNLSVQADSVRYEWYFIGKLEKLNFAWDSGTRDYTLPASSHQTEVIQSKPLVQQSTVESHDSWQIVDGQSVKTRSSSGSRSGATPIGWIVRMFVDGQLARVQASSPALELLGRDSVALAEFAKHKASEEALRAQRLR